MKNFQNISNRQRRRRITNELILIEQNIFNNDWNVNIETNSVSTSNIQNVSNSPCFDNEEQKQLISNCSLQNFVNSPESSNSNYNSTTNAFKLINNLNESSNNSICEKLSNWAVQEQIPLKSLTSLLKILKSHNNNDFSSLPSDGRSLLQTPKSTLIRKVHPGFYWHNGIKQSLIKYLDECHSELDINFNRFDLTINIDGLPISKSSNSQFWPILGSIFKTNYVFLIGLYHSYEKKPSDVHVFLEDFITEANLLINYGFIYKAQQFTISIKALCADAPAKAFVLNTKYHSGYSSCTKCDIEGDYLEHRVCFPGGIGNKRTDENFLNHKDS